MGFVDFVRFLLSVKGFVPALVSLVGTVLSLVFEKYIPSVPPEILQAFLALLTLVLSSWAAYNGGVNVERVRAAKARQ